MLVATTACTRVRRGTMASNWMWLAVGLGGIVSLGAIIHVLKRVSGRGRRDEE